MAAQLNGRKNMVHGKCMDCFAKPNPTTGPFQLTIKDFDGSDIRFKLFNIEGKILKSHCVESPVTNLSIGKYEDGLYFLKVMNGDMYSKLIMIRKQC